MGRRVFHVEQPVFHGRFGVICKSNALVFSVNPWDNIGVARGTSRNPPRAGLFNNLLLKENDMSNQSNDHALPNGFTFLAITGGYYGSWAKAHDPITAIKQAYKAEGGQGRKLVKVIYGKDEELHCTDMGAFQWEHGNPPTPIGLFTVTSRSIKPAEDGDFKHDLPTHLEWMEEVHKAIEWEEQRQQERLKREAARKEKPKAAEAQKERELARVLGKLLPAT